MRTTKKLFYVLSASVIFTLWFLVKLQSSPQRPESELILPEYDFVNKTFDVETPSMKYILQWTRPDKQPFTFMKEGQDIFFERKCSVTNCYVTWNKTYLADITDYDAILFYCHVVSRGLLRLPQRRAAHQNFVFVSPEAAAYYPVYHYKFNNFFNLTWTYKLDSDVFYGYILIKNNKGEIIGPKEVMHWPKIEEMQPIDEKLRKKLEGKKVAAAWVVSNCHAQSGRFKVATQIEEELAKHNLTLDIYGKCGTKQFPSNRSCWELFETDYYFYFSFENAINEDYVTEKLLNPLKHYTVPIVFGGANYTRFMPDGIYLNARTLSVKELVNQMVNLINNKHKYSDYFRWTNHFTYYYASALPEGDYYCDFCKKINDVERLNQKSIYKHFDDWWNEWIIEGS